MISVVYKELAIANIPFNPSLRTEIDDLNVKKLAQLKKVVQNFINIRAAGPCSFVKDLDGCCSSH